MIRHVVSALGLAVLCAAPAAAQDTAEGEGLYARYCATCHGADGTGTGPTAELMTLQPTDLTRLSAGNAGVFPTAQVVRRIDGRDPIVAHGSPMPIFGGFFEGEDVAMKTPAGQPILTSKPLADLVAWIESIQQGS